MRKKPFFPHLRQQKRLLPKPLQGLFTRPAQRARGNPNMRHSCPQRAGRYFSPWSPLCEVQGASHWLLLFCQLFSVPARRRTMFSLCFQTTTAHTPRASGSHVHWPLTASATGRAVTRVSDPSDTKPLRQITSRHSTEAASSCQKAVSYTHLDVYKRQSLPRHSCFHAKNAPACGQNRMPGHISLKGRPALRSQSRVRINWSYPLPSLFILSISSRKTCD